MHKLIIVALALSLGGCSLFFLGGLGDDDEPRGPAPLDGGPGDAAPETSGTD